MIGYVSGSQKLDDDLMMLLMKSDKSATSINSDVKREFESRPRSEELRISQEDPEALDDTEVQMQMKTYRVLRNH